jgi:transcription elongation factor Elf1
MLTMQSPLAYECRGYLTRPSCPRCGEIQLAAEAALLIGRGHVRNVWSCDGCGYAFESAVRLAVGDAGGETEA